VNTVEERKEMAEQTVMRSNTAAMRREKERKLLIRWFASNGSLRDCSEEAAQSRL